MWLPHRSVNLWINVSIILHNSSQNKLFSLSHCFVCLAAGAGVGGKLSRLVFLAPHPPRYPSKIILLILFILKYLNVKMYQLKT